MASNEDGTTLVRRRVNRSLEGESEWSGESDETWTKEVSDASQRNLHGL